MMECKKALAEAAGDMAKAEEVLRVKLGNKASKAAARVTAEGIVVFTSPPTAKLGAMVEVNCETDFVAKNDEFLALVKNVAELIATKNPADVEALLRSRSMARALKKSVRRWSARSVKTCPSAALSAWRPRVRLPATSTVAPRSAC